MINSAVTAIFYTLKTFSDMDECLMPDICTNGKCINRPGDYLCECNQGYKKDQSGKCVGKYFTEQIFHRTEKSGIFVIANG